MEKIKTSSDWIDTNGRAKAGLTITELHNAIKASESSCLQDAVYNGVLIGEFASTNGKKIGDVTKALVKAGLNKGTLSIHLRLAGLHRQVGLSCILDNLVTYKDATRTASLWGSKLLSNNAPALRKLLARIHEEGTSPEVLNEIREAFGLPVREAKEAETPKVVETTLDRSYFESVVEKAKAQGFLNLLIEVIQATGKVSLIGSKPVAPKAVDPKQFKKAVNA